MTGPEPRAEEKHCWRAQGEVLAVLAEALPGAGLPRLSALAIPGQLVVVIYN